DTGQNMQDGIPPEWLHPATLKDATPIQRMLADRVVTEDAFGPVRRLGGADTSANWPDPARMVHATMVSLDATSLTLTATGAISGRAAFPYVPGYLSFRESPWLLQAWRQLDPKPDLLFVDGHGFSHPRGIGIASHFGVL